MASGQELLRAEQLLNALGEPSRRAIVNRLSAGASTVSQLAMSLEITLTGVGQHLAVLEECGLVRTEKSGRVRVCRLDPDGLTVLEGWIAHHRSVWAEKLDQLGNFLDEKEE